MPSTQTLTALRSGTRILIVDDSPTQAERLRYDLEPHGYVVIAATNGRDALAAARAHTPKAIISDVVMPEMDGYTLCHQIKRDPALREIPVILLTGLSNPGDVIKGLECGADNFVRRPYDAEYLLSRLKYTLTNRELRALERERGGIEVEVGVAIQFGGKRYFINSERQQILDLLISTYEQAVLVNEELLGRQEQLRRSYESLKTLYRLASNLNQAANRAEVLDIALHRALELPGVAAGWLFQREGETGFRCMAARDAPPALAGAALDGDCRCQRQLLADTLDCGASLVECERLVCAHAGAAGLDRHASVPIRVGDQTIGILNLAMRSETLTDEEITVLDAVGGQIGAALERARLQEEVIQSNEELEAFSYSVSHDLRAPLRAIDGFSQALLDDAGGLDAERRGYLERVRAATLRMGQLIDDLLSLSRVTRCELQWHPVDLSLLAQSALAELQRAQPGRQAQCVITPGLVARGDARLLQVAIENLLGNAWKYTGKHPRARIEFGVTVGDDRRAYYVRDNGAGFDMAHAEKLFAPFQRLHSGSEFEGTGVGLATVARIIHRHGGRIWADAAVGAGATFYFTLNGPHTCSSASGTTSPAAGTAPPLRSVAQR